MHSMLIISQDTASTHTYLHTWCEKHHIHPLDRVEITAEKTIGIEHIRDLQKTIYLTPIKSPQKVIIIHHADTMTIQAQNASLKLLEEPPPHTTILLIADKKESFLPTILSRCLIITLTAQPILPPDSDTISFLYTITNKPLSEKLFYAQVYGKTKEEAIQFITTAQLVCEKALQKTPDTNNYQLLTTLHQTYKTLKTTNVNPRIVLEHFFLSL